MKIGDQISVIDDNLKGKITAINGEIVTLEDEHGFQYDFEIHKIILQEPNIYKGVKTVNKIENPRNISKKNNKKPFILDLHFNNLVKNTSNYSAFERINIQREELIKALDFCRKNNLKKMEIIHGIGEGVLQNMVYEVLENQTNLDYHNKEILHHQSGTVLVFLR